MAERKRLRTVNGKRGIVVHWGASAKEIARAVDTLLASWK